MSGDESGDVPITVAVRLVMAVEVSAKLDGDRVIIMAVRSTRPPSAEDVQRAIDEDEYEHDAAIAGIRQARGDR